MHVILDVHTDCIEKIKYVDSNIHVFIYFNVDSNIHVFIYVSVDSNIHVFIHFSVDLEHSF